MRCKFAVYKQFEVSVQKKSCCQQMVLHEVESNILLKESADNAEDCIKFKCVVLIHD
jgi:hypothetical protein